MLILYHAMIYVVYLERSKLLIDTCPWIRAVPAP
jgi:hypothetical protein